MRQQFWTTFGQYMSPLLSAEGEKINWVNYKTGEKNIRFRMEADGKQAVIGIELTHKDAGIQRLYFEQFLEVKKLFETIVGDDWQWVVHTTDVYGMNVSKIYKTEQGVSVFKKEDWPLMIRFFKAYITALDEFWSHVKWGFESLR